ncbi:glycosyltransferase family 9 protein [Candidatus Parcubacteria bacterium]|nr:MAG: glycosyltransferase family 9 protein [Candidatus Parcubacteria bacterium]
MELVRNDCRYFKGDIPCEPNKREGSICNNCTYYKAIEERILIIKLGAIGDVIRTTPLLRILKKEKPNAEINWLTYTPEIIPPEWVNNIINVTFENIEWLKVNTFDWLINLEKDRIAISLSDQINAKKKSGFAIDEYGKCKPFNVEDKAAVHKWLTGLFDEVSKENTKNYIEEVFEICGYKFNEEEYIISQNKDDELTFKLDRRKKIIGLNTGCGGRWTSRLWPEEYWIELAENLINEGYEVVLLGGAQEDEKNKRISLKSNSKYFGYFTLKQFINLLDRCDVIVTSVTMAMHLALALKKKLILFNNIFNKNEFYLYGRGTILEPDYKCSCYFSPKCENNCMRYIFPSTVLESIKNSLS